MIRLNRIGGRLRFDTQNIQPGRTQYASNISSEPWYITLSKSIATSQNVNMISMQDVCHMDRVNT